MLTEGFSKLPSVTFVGTPSPSKPATWVPLPLFNSPQCEGSGTVPSGKGVAFSGVNGARLGLIYSGESVSNAP